MTTPAEFLALVAEGRADAESLMLDTCTVKRLGAPVLDRVTGKTTVPRLPVYPDPSWPDEHPWKTGRCKVQGSNAQEASPVAAGHTFDEQRYRLDIPAAAPLLRKGDVVTITSAASNPNLDGKTYKVTGPFAKSHSTAQRVAVIEED